MRTHGKLTKWNDDRGFGFIEPAVGTEEIFVHISAFPRDGVRPCIGEIVSFETGLHRDGKTRAIHVMRPGTRATRPVPRRPRPAASHRGTATALTALISVLLLAAIGWYGYSRLTASHATDSGPFTASTAPAVLTTPAPTSRPRANAIAASSQRFRCDGRTRCSQMTSCAEATYFIKQCPGTEMDGDGDGIPCESQWCPSSWAD